VRVLREEQIDIRRQRAKEGKFRIQNLGRNRVFSDYQVTNPATGGQYRVSIRGFEVGDNSCTCPDFRTNTLGTCKHILHVLNKVKRRFSAAALRRPYRRKRLGLHLQYAGEVSLRLLIPDRLDEEAAKIVTPLKDRPIEDLHDLLKRVSRLQKIGQEVHVYPDAEEFIEQRLLQERKAARMAEIRRDPHNHPLRKTLLKIPLLP
jgi:uncharacterized Zn finger protein